MAVARAVILVLAGFAALATGTHRPSAWLFGRLLPLRARQAALALGYALLAASLAEVLAGPDAARELVEWFGKLTLGALIVVGALWAIVGRRR